MPAPAPVFPWWLWTLSVLWAAALVYWQRGAAGELRRAAGVLSAVYLALLVVLLGKRPSWTDASAATSFGPYGLGWVAGGLALAAGLVLCGGRPGRLGPWCYGFVALALSGLTALAGSVELAALWLMLGATATIAGPWTAARRETAPTDQDAATAAPGIADRDVWLIGLCAVVAMVVVLGTVSTELHPRLPLSGSERRANGWWERSQQAARRGAPTQDEAPGASLVEEFFTKHATAACLLVLLLWLTSTEAWRRAQAGAALTNRRDSAVVCRES